MDEGNLLKISLTCSVLGILAIYLASSAITAAPIDIGGIGFPDEGRLVKVCGTVTGMFTSRNRHVFFTVDDGEGIDVVAFNSTAQNIVFPENGEQACVVGEVSVYEGELELILRWLDA